MTIGDTSIAQRVGEKEELAKITASPYYMNNRKIFINYISSLFEKYKKEHDPIQLFKSHLIAEKILSEEQFEAIDAEEKAGAAAASEFAEESPAPTEAAIFEDVYFEVDRQTEAGRTGRHFFNN